MCTSIYTLGYARWTIDQVETQVQVLNALLVDVRRSPYTTKPGFSKEKLDDRLGARYVHISALGNVNYKGGPIELADAEAGLAFLHTLERPPILLCGCASPKQCHRSTVAQKLAADTERPITHLQSPSERSQPGLFDDE